MTKETFRSKSLIWKSASALFAVSSILSLSAYQIGWGKYPFALICLVLALYNWTFPFWMIEISDSGIKKAQRGRSGIHLIDRFLVEPDVQIDWDRIRSVATIHIKNTYTTIISPFGEPQFFPALSRQRSSSGRNSGQIGIGSAHFKDYELILKRVQERAPHARFDEKTKSIVLGQASRADEPMCIALVLVMIVVFLYLFFVRD